MAKWQSVGDGYEAKRTLQVMVCSSQSQPGALRRVASRQGSAGLSVVGHTFPTVSADIADRGRVQWVFWGVEQQRQRRQLNSSSSERGEQEGSGDFSLLERLR